MRRERPERAASPQPRATPWVPGYKALRPVRAKVWAHLLFITFALTGRVFKIEILDVTIIRM